MVKCGIDRIGEFGALFRGKRLGMVTSVSGVTLDLRPGYVKFHEVYPLVCLFGPEHGMYGKDGAGEDVDDVARDSATGLPIIFSTDIRRRSISVPPLPITTPGRAQWMKMRTLELSRSISIFGTPADYRDFLRY